MRTKTAMATTVSSTDRSAPPIVTPPARHSVRFFGFTEESRTPSPKALPAVMLSMAAIHFGRVGSSPSWGRDRHCRAASSTAATPSSILATDENVDGPPSSACPTGSTSTVTAPTTTVMPSTQPTMNAMLAAFAFGASSIRITAMIGTGEMATPRATGRMSPMTCRMRAPRPRRRETTARPRRR